MEVALRGESDEGSVMNVVVGGLACVWLGMVLAISFLEAPLKFRAPRVTLSPGLGIAGWSSLLSTGSMCPSGREGCSDGQRA